MAHRNDQYERVGTSALRSVTDRFSTQEDAERFTGRSSRPKIEDGEVYGYSLDIFNPKDRFPDLVRINRTIAGAEDLKKGARSDLEVREAMKGTISDPMMGATSAVEVCSNCGLSLTQCPGHHGEIELDPSAYFIDPIKMPFAEEILRCVCHSCYRLKVTRELLDDKGILTASLRPLERLKRISAECGDVCIRRQEALMQDRDIETRFGVKRESKPCKKDPVYVKGDGVGTIEIAMKPKQPPVELTVKKVLEIFENIPREDLDLLGFSPTSGPANYVTRSILVLPPMYRISTRYDTSLSDDKLGRLYDKIVAQNQILKEEREKKKRLVRTTGGSKKKEDVDPVAEIRSLAHRIIEGPKQQLSRNYEFTGFSKKFGGKSGEFRRNVTGYRVSNVGRAVVVNAKQTMPIDKIEVPYKWREEITSPETVTSFNMDFVKALFETGEVKMLEYGPQHKTSMTRRVTDENWRVELAKVRVGDKVHRKLRDGDIVLVNRAPTIYKLSIMAHYAVLVPGSTVGLSVVHTRPYKGDFDGDEYTLHFPQTVEARAEASELMSIQSCIGNFQDNGVTMRATFEAPMHSWNLTGRTEPLGIKEVKELTSMIDVAMQVPGAPDPDDIVRAGRTAAEKEASAIDEHFSRMNPIPHSRTLEKNDFLSRLAFHNVPLMSGKGVFSSTLPADFSAEFSLDDNDVIIKNGVLITGRIEKKALDIITMLIDRKDPKRGMQFIDTSNMLLTRYGEVFPSTVYYEDCLPPDETVNILHRSLVREANLVLGSQDSIGSDLDRKRADAALVATTDSIRAKMAKYMKKRIPKTNNLMVGVLSGAKGDMGNVMKIMLGPQLVMLKGRPMGMQMSHNQRASLSVSKFDRSIQSRGYCMSSIASGLTAKEILPLQMAARIGLADTADETPTAGGLRRDIAAFMSGVSVRYDSSVRNSTGRIVQFSYNSDNLDPEKIKKVNFLGYRAAFPSDPAFIANEVNQEYLYSAGV